MIIIIRDILDLLKIVLGRNYLSFHGIFFRAILYTRGLSGNMLPNIKTCKNGWSNFSENL